MPHVLRVIACCLGLLAAPASSLAAADRLVEKSIVTMPKSAGQFTLVQVVYDPAKPEAGVRAVYTFPGAPKDVQISVLANFIGRPPQAKPDPDEAEFQRKQRYDEAVDRIENARLEKIRSQTTDFKVGAPQALFLDRTPSFLVKPPGRSNGVSRGIARGMQFTLEGKAHTALSGVLYRDLFGITVTALIPGTDRAQVTAVPFADALKQIVPLVDIRNFGPCGSIEPGPGQTGGVYAMEANINRARDESCAETEADQQVPLPAGERRTIVFTRSSKGSG